MVQRRVLQCGLCRSKEKCLKPGLKCVNRWSSSTVQRKRVPESWSSNRETTSSSVQAVRRNWQKLLCGRPQRTRLIVWADQISKVASLIIMNYLYRGGRRRPKNSQKRNEIVRNKCGQQFTVRWRRQRKTELNEDKWTWHINFGPLGATEQWAYFK